MKLQQKKTSIIIYIKKDDELKGNENEGNIEYGNDFIICKYISA